MAKENTTLYAILGFLSHGDMTGYDIKKRINASISNFWDAGYGQIYPTLKMLEKEKFVTKSTAEKSKGPERILYSITETGRNKLFEWLSIPGEKEYVKYEILLKLFFGNLLPVNENIKRITEFRNKNIESLKTIETFKESLNEVLTENEDHLYYYLTVLFGEYTYKAYIDWSNEAAKLLLNTKKYQGVSK